MAPALTVGVEDLPKEVLGEPAEGRAVNWESALAKVVQQQLNMGKKDVLSELIKRFESTLLKVALDHTGGHRQNAAKLLGWGRNTLTRKLKELEIE